MERRLKSIAFRVAAASLPLVALLLIEAGLRVAGVEREARSPFHSVHRHEQHLVLNPAYVQRYFNTFSPGVAFHPFEKEKPEDSFRVFTFGGSTTAGFPAEAYAFPVLLRAHLESYLPSLRSEVVNLALTATNSFTIWDLSRDVVRLVPDAVVVYAGHNEYYGAFGAGTSVNRMGNVTWLKRLVIRLKRSVIYTLLEKMLGAVVSATDVEGRTMMAEAVGEASIPLDGEVFRRGVRQFEKNMTDAVRRFCDGGVPVYLATVTSNLSGQSPLGDDAVARRFFESGVEARARGDADEARTAFERARELDDLRFRAPEAVNASIRKLTAGSCASLVDVAAVFRGAAGDGLEGNDLFVDHLHPSVRGHGLIAKSFAEALVDHARLRGRQRLTLPDSEPVIDPLEEAMAELRIARLTMGHPFVRGLEPEEEARRYRRFVREFAARGEVDSLAALVVTSAMSEDAAFDRLIEVALQRADTVGALTLYRSVLGRRPFAKELAQKATLYRAGGRSAPELAAEITRTAANRWREPLFLNALASALMDVSEPASATIVVDWLGDHAHDSPAFSFNRARLALLQGAPGEATPHLQRLRTDLALTLPEERLLTPLVFRSALGLEVGDFGAQVWRGDNLRRAGGLKEAIESYEAALAQRPGELSLQNNIATVYAQLGDSAQAVRRFQSVLEQDSMYVDAWVNLGVFYLQTGDVRSAGLALGRAAAIDPNHPVLQRLRAGTGR